MSVKIIQERFEKYHCLSLQDEERAFKEIAQEVALAGLSRAGFFKFAVFQGGTCLRILYSLERFSEDLDFILKSPDFEFNWEMYLSNLATEFDAYGIELAVQDRSKIEDTVKKVFIKSDSIGKILNLKYPKLTGPLKKAIIKFELDTNPPQGSGFETRYLDFPLPFPVTVQDLPSLFAGKNHALLCREYTKGRDWFDFLWYVARNTPINLEFLANAINQQGPWQGQEIKVDKDWYLNEIQKKIQTTDWQKAKNDVARFLKPKDLSTLELWSTEFFLDRVNKIRSYL
ncbi:MAG: nucleotidyl transferase AbiEii/AbiGii toxin family protein [Pseudomonadota bacterium]